MSKKLAIFSVVSVLCIVGMVFVAGRDDDVTASSEENISAVQKDTCNLKTDKACPPGCNKDCCAAKQKAGTCPKTCDKTNCPKTCPKESQTACSKTSASSHKGTCGTKTDKACPPGCNKDCCAAKQKAGTCSKTANKTSCPKKSSTQ